jgi:hypothetical protein
MAKKRGCMKGIGFMQVKGQVLFKGDNHKSTKIG